MAEERVYIARRPPVDVALAAEEVRAGARSADDRFWILEDEGRVLGNLGIHAAGRPPGVAGLGMLVVAPARGRGGGRMLLDTAIAWARAADLHKVDLEVYLDNARAIALYASSGFVVEGVLRDHYRAPDGPCAPAC